MKDSFLGEVLAGVALVAIATALLTFWQAAMPQNVVVMLSALLLVAFGAFIAFVWRGRARDEREVLHQMFADRAAFLVGSAVLLVAVLYGLLAHTLNPWVLSALIAMVLVKLVARAYIRRKK